MNDSEFIEVELKLLVDDLEAVAARLAAAGAELIARRIYESNVRYDDADGTLSARGMILRLRQDQITRLTYKEPIEQVEDDMSRRFEAEVEIKNFHTMDIILRKLGFRPYVAYEKYRTTYALDRTEIVLDELPFGNFVEVEGAPEAIRAVINRLGLETMARYRETYLHLFDRVKAHLDLDFVDLTFDNFREVSVPAAAFGPPVNIQT
jgi:adenylate cyclase class 2